MKFHENSNEFVEIIASPLMITIIIKSKSPSPSRGAVYQGFDGFLIGNKLVGAPFPIRPNYKLHVKE